MPKIEIIPCSFPVKQGNQPRDRFAADCRHRHPVLVPTNLFEGLGAARIFSRHSAWFCQTAHVEREPGFPVTLYKEQWLKLLAMADDIRRFIDENAARLKTKE